MTVVAPSQVECRNKDFARVLRRSKPWLRRSVIGWRGFKGGIAWVMVYGGVPFRVRVRLHGLLDEWPYHVAFCEIVSMDSTAVLRHGRNKTSEWYKLVARRNRRMLWGRRGPRENRNDNIKALGTVARYA